MERATVNTMEENLSQLTSMPGEKADANEVLAQFHKSDDLFTANSNLFRVMCIVSDKQDYSYVEKVQLPEDEILGLCNKLVPASASSYSGNPPRIRINFKELDGLFLSTMGFYGDKKMMIEIFQKQCLVGDSVVSEMKCGQFKPGLYVITPKEAAGTLVAFYWHEGEHFREASRKDVSCNFIRYLVELCDCIYICVEGDYNFGALATAATRAPSKQGRTLKIEVKRVKKSENDVKLLPGFNVRVSGNVKVEMALPLFCEGYHRCCLLTAENRAPRTEVMNVKASEFGDTLYGWLSDSSVDYSKLSDEHFLNLLQYYYRGKYQKYLEWRDSFKTGTQLGIMADKVEFERCFLKVLPEFCSHVLLFIPTEWSEPKGRDYMDRYDQLHREFSMMLTGEDGRGNADRRVLIDRSDIRFICDDFEHRIIIQILGKGKPTLPFITYEQELSVTCSSQCSCSRRMGGTAKFLPFNSSKDFLLSGDKVRLVKLGENKKIEMEGIVQLLNSRGSVSAMRSWVENMVPAELKSLERNIVFTTFLLSSDYTEALMFIQNHLEIHNLQTLPVEFKNRVNQFQNIDANTLTVDPQKLLSHTKITSVCSQVYKKQEHKFLESVKENLSSLLLRHQGAKDQERKSFINLRDAKGMVTKFFGMEKDKEESEERVKQFKQAEDKYIQELKKNMPKNREGTLVTRYIEEFTYIRQQSKLKVKVSIVEDQQLSLVWKAQELIPLKKDVDELNSDSEHSIVPTCGKSFELVAINREQERLFKVFALRSGEIMVFIQNINDSTLYLYRCPKIGSNINKNHPIYIFKRGFDLLVVDESSRCMALYAKDKCKIAIYKFNESFSNVYPTGVEVHLEKFTGSSIITWMHLIPGKMELLIIDNTNRVRVVEIHEKPMMKPKYISFSWSHPISKACISADGFFLIVFRPSSVEDDDTDKKIPNIGTQLEIFVLGDMMSHLKTIRWNANAKSNVCDLEQLGLKITNFESQSHLVLYSHADAPCFLSSHVLKTVLAGEVSMLQKVQNKDKEMKETEIDGSCSYLAYIYHIFDKFGTTPALFPEDKKSVMFKVVLKSSTDPCNGEACIKYLQALLKKLRKAKEKDFSNITTDFQVERLKKWITDSDCLGSVAANDKNKMKMGMWVRLLICLVPLQIARAENNGIVALKDGLQIPPSISIGNSVSLANSIRFGLYDAVLDSWKGKIKVISSMGKQSSGKSYLLNHLSGSLLDVSGGRCTDGVWMTLTTNEESAHALAHGGDRCLYVLLDFEGLGSFERTEQEDMLLSVVNAAVSNLTIFNKRDFFLDKDTEIAFKRFQGGINLIEQDEKLFKGLLYIAIKDVDRDDVEDIKQEFSGKISQICNKSGENFITKMYDGNVEIAAMAHYNRSDYYEESLSELAATVKKQDSFYNNGSTFLRDLKLVISQIVAKDWTSIDSKRVALIVDIIRRNLTAVINMGCFSFANADDMEGLVNFDTHEEVPDEPVAVGNFSYNISDQGLCLVPSNESSIATSIRDVLSLLRFKLETNLPRKGKNGESWHSEFENFLRALGERRNDRVQQWVSSNTAEFCDHEEVKRLQLEASLALGELKQGLSVCGSKCSVCFWRCVLEKGHDQSDSAHSCMASHMCTENCTYCLRDGDNSSQCGDLAGHKGAHNCKEKNHTCGETCHLVEISSNCNKLCSLGPEHPGLHKCNSPQHVCKTTCSLPSCNNPCSVPIEPNHIEHRCHEKYCQSKCTIKDCRRTCGVADHFHGLDPKAEHLCGNEHACPENCELPGICEISTELVRQTRTFEGQRGSFEYELVSQQKGLRKPCCIPIPPFQRNHQGPHVHTLNIDSVHTCVTTCKACGYLCKLPVAHPGLHDTVHGNMKNVSFVSEVEDIDLEDRKYKWGEKGEAEMCGMYCRKQGRGHIHVAPCRGHKTGTRNLYDGSRHALVKYGPDVDTPKDEMTHETYWQSERFVDPCTEEESQEFGLCNHYCKHEEHKEESQASQKSYCTRKLWHLPLESFRRNQCSSGYVSGDGHHFACSHHENVPYHVIFVIDKSRSMGQSDIIPTMAMFDEHKCRLGCVYEGILRFISIRLQEVSENDSVSVILFDTSATLAVELQVMDENVVDSLLPYHPSGFVGFGKTIQKIVTLDMEKGFAAEIVGMGTNYSSGLKVAHQLMMEAAQLPSAKSKIPVVIFMSDGANNGGEDPLVQVEKMRKEEPRMVLHTILYGNEKQSETLEKMAAKGGGKFRHTVDGLQLAKSFQILAESLKKPVASYMSGHPD